MQRILTGMWSRKKLVGGGGNRSNTLLVLISLPYISTVQKAGNMLCPNYGYVKFAYSNGCENFIF